MSTPRIERGPMVAEVLERDYTRIGNRLIRDNRLDWRPKSIFIWMASHKDGFGVSPESIAAAGPGGISAVKSALRELEKYGYLTRSQQRTGGGTMGQTIYRITDMPSSTPVDENHPPDTASGNTENPRSEPVGGNPPAVEPPAADHPHKKTIPLGEDQLVEDELSLPAVPAPRAGDAPVSGERENPSSFEDPHPADPIPGVDAHTAQLADADTVTRVTDSWVDAYKRSSNGSEPSAKAVSRVRASAASRLRAGQAADDLSLIAADMAETNLAWTDLAEHEAHWLHKQQHALTGTDATVKGWLDLAGQLSGQSGGRQPYQPYRDDAWHRLDEQARLGQRPDGWERVPFCGHLDCDEITRMRQIEDSNGLKSLTYCSSCHPALQF